MPQPKDTKYDFCSNVAFRDADSCVSCVYRNKNHRLQLYFCLHPALAEEMEVFDCTICNEYQRRDGTEGDIT